MMHLSDIPEVLRFHQLVLFVLYTCGRIFANNAHAGKGQKNQSSLEGGVKAPRAGQEPVDEQDQ